MAPSLTVQPGVVHHCGSWFPLVHGTAHWVTANRVACTSLTASIVGTTHEMVVRHWAVPIPVGVYTIWGVHTGSAVLSPLTFINRFPTLDGLPPTPPEPLLPITAIFSTTWLKFAAGPTTIASRYPVCTLLAITPPLQSCTRMSSP